MLQTALRSYRDVLRLPGYPLISGLALLVRLPLFAVGVALALHAVNVLGASWAQAGLLTTATTVTGAITSPLRGRLLDRIGLRRTVAPCLLITGICWCVGPFLPYVGLLVACTVAGLFTMPIWSIIRQAILAITAPQERQAALSLDSALAEVAFMGGPLLGIWAATSWPPRWSLTILGLLGVVAGVGFIVANVPLVAADHEATESVSRRQWFTPGFAVILAASAAASMVLTGTDVGIVATLRDWGRTADAGWVMAVWGFGSLLGGLVYGGLARGWRLLTLLALLSIVTIPASFAVGPLSLAILVTVAGLLCAPCITSASTAVAESVSPSAMGEAMGWHGSAMTVGAAIGAPFAGFVMDHAGAHWGFAAVGSVGLLVAVVGTLAVGLRRRQRDVRPEAATVTSR